MLVELWVGNFATLKGFVNGTNGNFHYYIVQFVQNHCMDKFLNLQIGINMRIQHPQTYKDFPTFKKNWTRIE
jgi:hypothetical protein